MTDIHSAVQLEPAPPGSRKSLCGSAVPSAFPVNSTDFPEHNTLQLHKMHLSSSSPLNTFLLCLHCIFYIH